MVLMSQKNWGALRSVCFPEAPGVEPQPDGSWSVLQDFSTPDQRFFSLSFPVFLFLLFFTHVVQDEWRA